MIINSLDSGSGPREVSLKNWLSQRYVVHREISRGGMGVVLHARHIGLDLDVAVKLILSSDPSVASIQRFQQEARILATLDHRNIVRLRDYGVEGGVPYLAMEFIPGQTFLAWVDEAMRTQGQTDIGAVVETLTGIADALVYCHERGVTHRDVKPHNILLRHTDNRPVLADFGLVKTSESVVRSQSSELLGTPGFMAPEQADKSFGAITAAADVWGFGATLFYALTGRPPFDGASLVNLMKALMTRDAPLPSSIRDDVPAWLDELCASCLTRDLTLRPTMAELAAALRAGPPEAPPSSRRWLAIPALLLALGGLAGIVATARGAPPRTAPTLSVTVPIAQGHPPRPEAPREVTPPILKIEAPTRTFRPEFKLRGEVDQSGCTITVEGRPVPLLARAFEIPLALQPGANEWTVVARNPDGASTRRQVRVIRREGDAAELVVGAGGDLEDLKEALSLLADGGTIRLLPGTYEGGLSLERPLTIIGKGPADAIIIQSREQVVLRTSAPDVTLRSLKIQQLGEGALNAVEASAGRLTLEDCTINSARGIGVYVKESATKLALSRCQVHDCGAGGVEINQGTSVDMKDCEVRGNTGFGLHVVKAFAAVKGGEFSATQPFKRPSAGADPKKRVEPRGHGLWIANGRGDISGAQFFNNSGAGITLAGNLRPDPVIRLSDCTSRENGGFGLAVEVRAVCEARALTCAKNKASGAYIAQEASLVARGCRFEGNEGFGVESNVPGVKAGRGNFQGCSFIDNNKGPHQEGRPGTLNFSP